MRERDAGVTRALEADGKFVAARRDLVYAAADEVLQDGGQFYRIYTPYRRRWDAFAAAQPHPPIPSLRLARKRFSTAAAIGPTLEVPRPEAYPIVDAAMMQLNTTGWMHNRLRMIVASFLTKHLLLDYRAGERYFEQRLADADLAANNGGWQWSASTGTDAAPYFRIFNPTLQGKTYDPDGAFVRRMLPVLANVPVSYVHQPWAMPPLARWRPVALSVATIRNRSSIIPWRGRAHWKPMGAFCQGLDAGETMRGRQRLRMFAQVLWCWTNVNTKGASAPDTIGVDVL
jgi:deoxyribodipyrimidine photolyase